MSTLKPLPIFLVLLISVSLAAPATAFDFSDILKPIDDLFKKINEIIYRSDIIEQLELFKANYELVNGIYVEKTTWSILNGQLSAQSGDEQLNLLASKPDLNVILQFRKLPPIEDINRIAELLGAEVFHIDRGINAVILKLADKPKLKEFILTNASNFDIASIYLDFTVQVPEKPHPIRKPKKSELPEHLPDNKTNNTIERGNPFVGNPHHPVKHAKNETRFEKKLVKEVKEVKIEKDQIKNANWNDKLVKAEDVWADNVTGRQVVIAILDTGVDENHPMLNGSIIGSISFVEGEDPHDYHGHGTHVASIAAGRPVQVHKDSRLVWVSGIAPNAAILNVKVLGKNGGGSLSTVIKGLDYVAQWHDSHPDVPIVVSMSLGTPYGNPSDPVCQKVNWLVEEKHIPVVVAAGNEYFLIDSPGLAEKAITVAAVDGEKNVASFSGKGPGTNYKDIKPDIAAPGVKIPGARANTNDIIEMSGTSMATPHVAGVIALLLEDRPDLKDKPDEIRKIIEQTAIDTAQPEILEGHGIADAYAAVENLPSKNRFSMFDWFKNLFGGG